VWRFVSEAFSWPVVEAVLGQGYLIVGHFFELAVLGKELAQATFLKPLTSDHRSFEQIGPDMSALRLESHDLCPG
jgi:hypothetical protein